MKLLERLESFARAEDPRVTQVMAHIAGSWEVVMVARSDGHMAADVRPLVRVSITVIMEEDGRREQGSAGGGGRYDYGWFCDDRLHDYARQAVHQARTNLGADPAPAGTMPVVLGPGWPGILLHEAIGHGLEGDFNRKGSSAFSGRIGQKVAPRASPWSTTARCRTPRLAVDRRRGQPDRAHRADRGRHPHRLHAGHDERAPDGHAAHRQRPRESFAHLPLPRMTNTYMLERRPDPEEIIKSVKKGCTR